MRTRRSALGDAAAIADVPEVTNASDALADALSPGGVLDEAEQYLRQCADVRSRLLEERDRKLSELRRIEDMLAMLPGGSPGRSPARRAQRPVTGRTDTIPGLLLSIIGDDPGITAKEVHAEAVKKRPKLLSRDTLANLYRLQHKRGLIRGVGPRGATRYYLAGGEEAAAALS